MGWAKDFYHEDICEMAEVAEQEALHSFYDAPHDSLEAFRFFIDEETRIVDSYPHDLGWARAVAHLAMYGRGIMGRTGNALP